MSWTEPRTWHTREVVPDGELNRHIRDNLKFLKGLVARKTAAESVTSSTAFQADDQLFLDVLASEVYRFEALIKYDAAGAGDLKWRFTIPAAAALQGMVVGLIIGAATPSDDNTRWSDFTVGESQGGMGAGTDAAVYMVGQYIGGVNGGTIAFEWAQDASNATATRVKDGSFLLAHHLV